MRIIQLHIYLLVCCGAAEGFTEKSVDLGQDVTLKCEVAVKDALWFLMKPSEPPVFILRSFTSKPANAQYSNMTFSQTFSVQHNSSLFIHNISSNKLGVYYCIRAASPPNISSGIRLYIQNHSAGAETSDNNEHRNRTGDTPETTSRWAVPLTLSLMMNVALAVVLTVFTVRHRRRPPKAPARPPDPGSQPRQDNPSSPYEEVHRNVTNSCTKTANGIYALLQHPRPGVTQSDPE